MPVPAPVNTTNADAGGDNPQVWRADALDLTQKFNTLLEHLAPTSAGVAVGEYAVAITNVVNASSATSFAGKYMRLGSLVTVHFGLTVIVSAAGLVSMHLALPIASNFTTTGDGTGSGVAAAPVISPVLLLAISSDVMSLQFTAAAAGFHTVNGSFMYRVQ